MIKPVAWIGQDAFAALLGGETICQTMTPSQAMYDDVPLTVIPPGFAIVPVEPTEAQWSGLARDIMFVLRQERPTPKKLFYHLTQLGHTLPNWMADETELRDPASDHVISKGTCCVLIYKAMLTAAAKGE